MTTDFGKFCRKLRIDNNELMKDMANKLGVTTSYLSAIEKGKRNIPTDWAEQIAEHYELTEKQVIDLTNLLIIDSLSEREILALNEAVSVLYLNDNSDYINGLWGVVKAIIGDNVVENEGFNIRDLSNSLGTFKDS
jgi:transcriptional regulator with XRE-family HTH domain